MDTGLWHSALWTAGPQAGEILDLWRLTLAVCLLVFLAVLAALAFALRRSGRATRETPAELGGLAVPEAGPRRAVAWALSISAVLLGALLVQSVATDRALAALPLQGALHVEVTGHQWWWAVHYDDPDPSRTFDTANELHLPVGRPVVLTLRSADVIHSLWIPSLAGKKDLIPGRTATLVLRADRPGAYRATCAEFCGWQHAWMALPVIVESQAGFDEWASTQRQPAKTPTDTLALQGRRIVLGGDCVMCHRIAGTEAGARSGPDLTHLAGRATLAAGALPNDPAHLAAWITDPSAHKPGVAMPAHAFKPDELHAVVAYLQSLQ
ncbi:cytochrome c oxidase subunit II [Ideonella sp. YS5]|uniref:cytochrome c oxidase subunit II n=1 Tax=Ideonella sp. YS5 TaxID=3453714 RepID=UPI003EED330E